MASITGNTRDKSLRLDKTADNPKLRQLSGKGFDINDMVILNSAGIGSIENKLGWQNNSNLNRYGNDRKNEEFWDFSIADVYLKKNIPFFNQSYTAKLQQLRKYAVQDEIENILDTLADEIVVYDTQNKFGSVVWEEDPNMKPEFQTIIKTILNENFIKIYNLFGFKNENTSWHYVKKFLVDGFLAFEIIYDDSKTNIIGFKELDPISLIPKIFEDGARGWIQYPDDNTKKIPLTDAQVIFISYSSINGDNRVSYVERLVRSFNLLRIMEQSRIIWAVVNSASKTKFVIPVSGKSKTAAKQTLGSLMNSYRENIDFDNESGSLQINGKSQMPFSKEYWIPEGDSGTPTIENVGNDGPDMSDTGMLEYFQNKLVSVSKMPRNRFSFGGKDGANYQGVGASEQFTREEIYFGRFLSRLRGKLEELILKPVILQTRIDVPEVCDDPMFENRVSFNWVRYDVFEEIAEAELLQKRLSLVQTAKDSLKTQLSSGEERTYFADEYLVKRYLKMNDADVALNSYYKKIEDKENLEHEKNDPSLETELKAKDESSKESNNLNVV